MNLNRERVSPRGSSLTDTCGFMLAGMDTSLGQGCVCGGHLWQGFLCESALISPSVQPELVARPHTELLSERCR